jgi:hypothetical protein
VHDIVDLEGRGLAGVLVATVEFTDAAEHQARALGADPAAVYVRHPIQDRTDSEMIAIADEAFARLLTQLVNETPNGR